MTLAVILPESFRLTRVILATNVILRISNQAGFCLAVTGDLGRKKGGIPPTCGTGNR